MAFRVGFGIIIALILVFLYGEKESFSRDSASVGLDKIKGIEESSKKLPADLVSVYLHVEGASPSRGQIIASLFNSRESFLRQGEAFAVMITKIDKYGKALLSFTNVPPGSYAISVLYDENEDGKLDLGFLGISLEKMAFSRNAKVPFGLPSFDHARINILSSIDPVIIDLKSAIYP